MSKHGKLKIIPLGGLGEVGKNMTAYEFNNQILIVDTGIMFPKNDMLGIDYIIPDYEYLRKKADKVVGIVITHGHEDHIGAIHHVLNDIPAPVYATPLTRGLIEVKLARNNASGKARLHTVEAGGSVEIGAFKVEFFHICHSIPDSVGLGITTPAGFVVHMSDFKFDHTPVDGWPTDYATLAEFSRRGVDLLLSDSTNSERPGWTPSEMVIGPAFDKVFTEAPGRVIVATFASNIARVQQVLDAAADMNRNVSIIGRSMEQNFRIASDLGYLKYPPSQIVTKEQIKSIPDKQLVIATTGAQSISAFATPVVRLITPGPLAAMQTLGFCSSRL